MGTVEQRPCCPEDLPADVAVREMRDADWTDVTRIYAEGHRHPQCDVRDQDPHPEPAGPRSGCRASGGSPSIDGAVVGWASISPVSARPAYAGVGESSIYVADGRRGRGVGKALIHRQVNAADEAGLWTLQTSVFPENRASIALHHSAGFRTLGIREKIGQLDGVWRDTVFLERRSACC